MARSFCFVPIIHIFSAISAHVPCSLKEMSSFSYFSRRIMRFDH